MRFLFCFTFFLLCFCTYSIGQSILVNEGLHLALIKYKKTITNGKDAVVVLRLENNSPRILKFSTKPDIYCKVVALNKSNPDTVNSQKIFSHAIRDRFYLEDGMILNPGESKDFEILLIYELGIPEKGKYRIQYFMDLSESNKDYPFISTKWMTVNILNPELQ